MRSLLLSVLVVASLAALAVAAEADPGDAAAPLSAARVSALTPVLEDAQILDAAAPAPAKLTRFAATCRKLPRTDRLVVAFRSVCRAEGDAFVAGLRLPKCRTADRCRARLTRYAKGVEAQAAASRRLNATLKTSVPDVDCRRAMRIGASVLQTLTRLGGSARSLVRSIGKGTAAQVNAGVGRFYAIDRSPLADHRGRLDAFRAACT